MAVVGKYKIIDQRPTLFEFDLIELFGKPCELLFHLGPLDHVPTERSGIIEHGIDQDTEQDLYGESDHEDLER